MSDSPWHQAKTALAARLATVAITDPIAQAIAYVFVEPPASIEPGSLPAITFGESTLHDEWNSSLAREHYELTCSLSLRDEDIPRAIALVEAYRDAIKDKLRLNLTLLSAAGISAGLYAGPTFTGVDIVNFAAGKYVGCQFTLPMLLTVPVEYADSDA